MNPSNVAPYSDKIVFGQAQTLDPRQSKLEFSFFTRKRKVYGQQTSESNSPFLQRKLFASSDDIRRNVEINPRVMHGNPVFSGTRIPLYQIVEELANTANVDRLREGYPSLTSEQIVAGLDFISSLLRIHP